MPGLTATRTDPLTGLENRRVFEDSLRQEIDAAHNAGRPLGLALFDLDSLERINGEFGPDAGDEALCRFGTILAQSVRAADLIARLGGDEFAAVAPGAGEPETYLIAERVRHEISGEADPYTGESMTVSAGIAVFPRHGETPNDLIRRAHLALYGAKQLGRDRTAIYGAAVSAAASIAQIEDAAQVGGLATLLSLAEVVDVRHYGGRSHSQRVGRYAEAIARELGLEDAMVDRIRLASLLHDIGKIGVPPSILNRPGPLDPSELAELQRHPLVGSRIVRNAGFDEIAGWIAAHHERPDGCGYPIGLSGEQVPLPARILAVADAYEAMTSDRVYRSALTPSEARRELLAGVGTQFYREVVEGLIAWLERRADERQAWPQNRRSSWTAAGPVRRARPRAFPPAL